MALIFIVITGREMALEAVVRKWRLRQGKINVFLHRFCIVAPAFKWTVQDGE